MDFVFHHDHQEIMQIQINDQNELNYEKHVKIIIFELLELKLKFYLAINEYKTDLILLIIMESLARIEIQDELSVPMIW